MKSIQKNNFFLIRLVICFCLFSICISSCKNPKHENSAPTIEKKNKTDLQEQANGLYESNKYEDALLLFKELIALDSLNGEYYYKSAYCETMLFSYDKSIPDYKKAIALNYKLTKSYLSLTANYSAIDSERQARFYANKCLELDSSYKAQIDKALSVFKKTKEGV